MSNITITRTTKSRLSETDYDNLGFGQQFSDHMFQMEYRDGQWRDPAIVPFGDVSISPAALALHYGQSVFEGLKAYRGVDDKVRLFRPDMNYQRLMTSCERLCMPRMDESTFVDALIALTQLEVDWIPRKRGQSFYLRPLMVATEPSLQVRPAEQFMFFIMASPVREFFDENIPAVSLKVEQEFTRAAPGGMGYAKTAGNYAAAINPGQKSIAAGYDQVLWLDGRDHRYVEEVGQMNIFFRFTDRIVTPELRGTILPGITRDSTIALLKERGMPCEERLIDIQEIVDGVKSGELLEAFGTGTAAVIAPVGKLNFNGEDLLVNAGAAGDLSQSLYDELLGIQQGEVEDTHGWTVPVPIETAVAAPA